MPTISQLPAASPISAADEVPISQAGVARAASVGALLASTQTAITLDSQALLGRTSLGPGFPEQVDVGSGLNLSNGTLVANGRDHAAFPMVSSFSDDSHLVISNQGSPMLISPSLLRGLFSAGQNIAIDPDGVISSAAQITGGGTVQTGSFIGNLKVITGLSTQDLVAVSQSGSDHAVTYGNFLDGITMDQAQPAAPVSDSDALWVSQGSNVMTSQTFGVIWAWIANKLSSVKTPVVEVSANTALDATVHNGRLLVCSKPLTLTPLTANMGSGFQCIVINASSGSVTLGSGFLTSSGSLILAPLQSATLFCASYSAGTIAFAAMPTIATATLVPGQVVGVTSSALTSSTVMVSWQAPPSGGLVVSYLVQYRQTGTIPWNNSSAINGATTYQLTGLQSSASYDVVVTAQNAAGAGAASSILTVVTASSAQSTLPAQVTGLVASSATSSSIQLSWSAQSGATAATSFVVEFRTTGSSSWTSSVAGLSGTGTIITGLQSATTYDFSVFGSNTAGSGPSSSTVVASTLAASQAVSAITWNFLSSPPYARGIGAVGVNAQVSPASSPIQFGFSPTTSTPPTNWTVAALVNSNLWGAYLPTPAAAGTWYVWAEGLDGSARTINPNALVVQ